MLWFLFIFIKRRGRGQGAEAISQLTSSTHKHENKTSNTTQLTTLDTTWVAPSEYRIRRGSDCPLGAPCLNPRLLRWLTRCPRQTRRGHWPNHLPSSCNPGWWRLSSAVGCKGSQSRTKKPTSGCSTPLSHPGGAPSPSCGHPSSSRDLELILVPVR
jgi:hypothetical protein